MRAWKLLLAVGSMTGAFALPACSSGDGTEAPPGFVPDWQPPIPAQNGTCPEGRKLCAGQCADLKDPNFGCGTCTPCAIPHAQSKCEQAGATYACSIAACDTGFQNCNKFPNDGCEAALADDAKNCGACGNVCPGSGTFIGVCKANACTTGCAAGTNLCGGACVTDSAEACGASCKKCEAPANGVPTCETGACGYTCKSGFTKCASGCCSACGDTGGLQVGAPWPMEGRCPTHIGRAAGKVDVSLSTKWTYPGAFVVTNPAIAADGTLYFGSWKAMSLTALSSSGTLKWSATLDGYVSAMPAIGVDGTIYAPVNISSGSKGKLVAISPGGTVKWSVDLAGPPSSPAIGGKGTIYVNGGQLTAISASGSIEWTVPTNKSGSVAIANDGTVYVAGDRLYAVSPAGTVKWTYPSSAVSSLGSPVVTPDDGVYIMVQIGAGSYVFHALDSSGKDLWGAKAALLFDANLPVVAGDGKVYNTGYITSIGNRVFQMSATGANPLSAPTTGLGAGNGIGNPVIDGNDVMFVFTQNKVSSTSTQNRLNAIDPSGKVTSTSVTQLANRQPTIGADGTLYAAGLDGTLYAFGK